MKFLADDTQAKLDEKNNEIKKLEEYAEKYRSDILKLEE